MKGVTNMKPLALDEVCSLHCANAQVRKPKCPLRSKREQGLFPSTQTPRATHRGRAVCVLFFFLTSRRSRLAVVRRRVPAAVLPYHDRRIVSSYAVTSPAAAAYSTHTRPGGGVAVAAASYRPSRGRPTATTGPGTTPWKRRSQTLVSPG